MEITTIHVDTEHPDAEIQSFHPRNFSCWHWALWSVNGWRKITRRIGRRRMHKL